MNITTRLAPSPSGRLHTGNIYAFLIAYIYARRHNGNVLLRIDDLDRARSKQHFIDYIFYDFDWLGFEWDGDPIFQSERDDMYRHAFQTLYNTGDIYPCFCTRADIAAATAPHEGEYSIYPGTCAHLDYEEERMARLMKEPSYRMRIGDTPFTIADIFQGEQIFYPGKDVGDFVIRRADGLFAYQLASVVDDELMGITHVIRGRDLLQATPSQIRLIEALGYREQTYGHVPLLRNAQNERLAKRAGDKDIEVLRDEFKTPEQLLGYIAFQTGLIEEQTSYTMAELIVHVHMPSENTPDVTL